MAEYDEDPRASMAAPNSVVDQQLREAESAAVRLNNIVETLIGRLQPISSIVSVPVPPTCELEVISQVPSRIRSLAIDINAIGDALAEATASLHV